MQNWKNLARSVAAVVFCGAITAGAQSEGEKEASEDVSESAFESLPAESTTPEATTPTESPVETPPPMLAPPPEIAPPSPNDEPLPRQIRVGAEGFFRPGILLQGWFFAERAEKTTTTFRARRAELRARGEIVPGLVEYSAMVDLARLGAGSILQDFFITVKTSYVDVSLGQFKTPVSWEGYNSTSRLLFPERALASREFGDWRDLGIRLAKNFKYFGYSAGVFNGAGQNVLDVDNAKDVTLRLEAYPIEGLVVAGVAYMTVGNRKANVKDRYEMDARFERGPFLFQAEYIRARDIKDSAPAVNGRGFYGAVAWTFWELLQPCFRVGYMDPNIRAKSASGEKDRVWQMDVGLNYYLRKHEAKFQLSYSRFQYRTLKPSNEFIFAAQVAF
jgi:hypothetical protein